MFYCLVIKERACGRAEGKPVAGSRGSGGAAGWSIETSEKEAPDLKQAKITENCWWRCAQGKHPYPSRTRWLRPGRPMVLHWRRCGRVGGCQILKNKTDEAQTSWGCSSVGRAPALQAGGQGFESLHLQLAVKQFIARKRTLKTAYREKNIRWIERSITRHPRINRGKSLFEKQQEQRKLTRLRHVTLYMAAVKQRRAQGGCLGTKSR